MKRLLQRIFDGTEIPKGLSKQEFQQFMDEHIAKFEEGGYLASTKLPPINDESHFIEELHHADNDLVVLKFWKRRCLPCLSMAEMYKEAEQHFDEENKRLPPPSSDLAAEPSLPKVRFFSINTKDPVARPVVDRQMVEGTPTIQVFQCGRQVGGEIQSTQLEDFIRELNKMRVPMKCPEWSEG